MSSITAHTYNMLNHLNEREEHDFPLYPDPQTMFSPPSFPFSAQNFNVEGSTYTYQDTQEGFPVSSSFPTTAMYATEAPQYLESPDLRGAPSNYSTASGPSASSSAMGSPHSIHNGTVPVHEWASQGPSIVGYDGYAHGNEYTFAPLGMDEFDLSFNPAKPGFVGECQNISRPVYISVVLFLRLLHHFLYLPLHRHRSTAPGVMSARQGRKFRQSLQPLQ
jgi:hypothetical protein